ncbi:MAG: patatin-like phospholipase family protein [Sphingobacteriaceae bacterium]|nr:patatin-like phospholipase family protein [Cytophagaceae bacterium]
MNSIPTRPLGNIALSFSGGGFRAGAFCLGSLSYLHHAELDETDVPEKKLLHRVRFIASASGGSFASLTYAAYLYAGRPFADGYHALRDFMNGELLVKLVVAQLSDDTVWQRHPTKQRNLINAFALVYDEFFGEATPDPAMLALFCNPDVVKHLREICVNSTELLNGLSFRFQNPDGDLRQGLVGNFSLHLRRDHLDTIRKLKLGDIMAASSCFPVGFEPMVFPGDFAYPASATTAGLTEIALREALYSREPVAEAARLVSQETAARQENAGTSERNEAEQAASVPISAEKSTGLQRLSEDAEDQARLHALPEESDNVVGQTKTQPTAKEFGLMDGGIDDNQGIQSLLLADRRARKSGKGGFDLLLVCDVSSPFLSEKFKVPNVRTDGFWRRHSVRFWALAVSLMFGTLLVGGLSTGFPPQTFGQSVALALGGLGLLVGGGLFLWLRDRLDGVESEFDTVVRKYLRFFLNIPSGSLE